MIQSRILAGDVPAELIRNYLDAFLQRHVFPADQEKEAYYALLFGLASADPALEADCRKVIGQFAVLERWRLGRLIDEIDQTKRARIREQFAAFRVGMLSEDFTLAEVREYPPNSRIFSAGEDAREAFLIEAGTVIISKSGRKIVTYNPGELFGNLPFLVPVKRTADAFAWTRVRARVLTRSVYLERFAHYTAQRQQDEYALAFLMIRQLILGLAEHEFFQKVLLDHLLPEQSRAEQQQVLAQWVAHFADPDQCGEERLYALFNLLEIVDRETPFLAHLDTAEWPVVSAVLAAPNGVLRGVALSGLRPPSPQLSLLDHPAELHRLYADLGTVSPPLPARAMDVVLLADFLLPPAGPRRALLRPEDLPKLQRLLAPQGVVYYVGPKSSSNLRMLRQGNFDCQELAHELCVLKPPVAAAGIPEASEDLAALAPPAAPVPAPAAAPAPAQPLMASVPLMPLPEYTTGLYYDGEEKQYLLRKEYCAGLPLKLYLLLKGTLALLQLPISARHPPQWAVVRDLAADSAKCLLPEGGVMIVFRKAFIDSFAFSLTEGPGETDLQRFGLHLAHELAHSDRWHGYYWELVEEWWIRLTRDLPARQPPALAAPREIPESPEPPRSMAALWRSVVRDAKERPRFAKTTQGRIWIKYRSYSNERSR